MGGAYQPVGHVSLITNIIDFGMNVQEAGDAFRWMHSGSTQPVDNLDDNMTNSGVLNVESGIDYDVVRALRDRGHTVRLGENFFGRFQIIMRDHENGVYLGGSEGRVDGQAAGY